MSEQTPIWRAPGVEPPEDLKENGWRPLMKPSAQHMNWLFNQLSILASEAGVTVEDLLTSDSAVNALSAKQGKFLKSLIDLKYQKPTNGIPKNDLTSDVQTSLGKADTALQSVSKTDVGLGSVQNYSVATQAEAEAGTSSSRYMTPQRTKQAIDKTVGALSTLETSNKTNIVQAINEINTEVTNHLAQNDHVPYAVDSGTANAKVVSITPTPTSYTEGMAIAFKNAVQNTGAVTINVNGLGAKPIVKSNGNPLTNGNLKANSIYTVRYNGTSFFLQGEGGEYGTATASQVLQGFTVGTESGVVNGTIVSKGAQVYTPGTTNQVIPVNQFLGGPQTILGDSDLIPSNIKNGVEIFGVVGTMEQGKRRVVQTIMSSPSTDYFTRSNGSTNLNAAFVTLSLSGLGFTVGRITVMQTNKESHILTTWERSDFYNNGAGSYGNVMYTEVIRAPYSSTLKLPVWYTSTNYTVTIDEL